MGERMLRPGIKDSDRMAALIRSTGWMGGYFFACLLTVVDDYGRFDARPARLRAEVFPLLLELVREADVSRCLEGLRAAGLVRLYTVDGKPYLEIFKFRQRLRAEKSKWPDPPSDAGQCHDIVGTMPTETYTETETLTETETSRARVASGDDPPSHPDLSRFLDATNIAIHANPLIRGKCVEMLTVAGLDRSIQAVETARKKHPGFGIPRLVSYALGIITNQQVDKDTGNGEPTHANGKFKRRAPTREDVA